MRLPDGMDAISRRRFLTLLSASASLAMGTSCSKIDRGSIVPYTRRPGEIIPGVATYYASTFQEGLQTLGVLVKTREGRPIHIEGNKEHSVSRGKTSLRAIGDLLGLYDPDRLRTPSHNGAATGWGDVVQALTKALNDARLRGKPVLFLTGAPVSPSQQALLHDLKVAIPSLQHAAWEPAAPQTELAAATALYGKAIVPQFHLDSARIVLSLQSDFLGTESIAPILTRDFAARRAIHGPGAGMNRLWVLEGSMTLTGANADQRLQVRPSEIAAIGFALIKLLSEMQGVPLPAGLNPEDLSAFEPGILSRTSAIDPAAIRTLANDLGRARNSALVLAGPALPPEAHTACHLLNAMLGSDGNTLSMNDGPSLPVLISYRDLQSLLKDAAQGRFALGIFWGTNPAYAFPDPGVWRSAIAKIPETYRIGLYEDETALDCAWRLPEHHWLESWGDFEPSADFVSLRQPVIGAIHNTRQAEELLLSCMRRMNIQTSPSYLEYIKTRWRSDVYPVGSPVPFESFWNAALHDGGTTREPRRQTPAALNADAVQAALKSVKKDITRAPAELELVLFPASGLYDGRYANNGWMNEFPDPVTKATWGNPLLLSATDATRLDVRENDVLKISTGNGIIHAPVIVQPGQAPGVAAIALGYGRRTGSVAVDVGANAYSLVDVLSKSPFLAANVRVEKAGPEDHLYAPKTQVESRLGGRDFVRSWTLSEYSRKIEGKDDKRDAHPLASLIPVPEFPEHKWGMVIDLSACTGCSACVLACQSENNIAVVGPDRVARGRVMHWIRIDRYYEGDARDPRVLHQPMLCQQCDNAPCEIVCPVNATTHSPEGLNQMVYNRCVGTRYCSNNCPFKVRRFNFFDYTSMKREPESLVYNPEVTVRPRGVMEKCTFCIQRIQNVKQIAKAESRKIRDGEIQTACAAACPANAIVFGDLNDVTSRVATWAKMNRKYLLLEELGIRPSVTYLADISNPAIAKDKA
jgi:Fe-S-cluster-containing dehydrogenase component